jgi:hypothetical protein
MPPSSKQTTARLNNVEIARDSTYSALLKNSPFTSTQHLMNMYNNANIELPENLLLFVICMYYYK